MIIVIGLILGCALLYFWLQGHWFARIIAVPIWAIAAFVICAELLISMMGGMHENANHPGAAIIALCVGCPIGWIVGSLPVWFWRARMRTINEAEMRSLRPAG